MVKFGESRTDEKVKETKSESKVEKRTRGSGTKSGGEYLLQLSHCLSLSSGMFGQLVS
jgi:hypothetical protein